MGVFDDKKFEQLDWMTQITETIQSDLNEILGDMRERVEYKAEDIARQITGEHSIFSIEHTVRGMLEQHPKARYLTWEEQSKITSCFKWETSPDLELDLRTLKLSHPLYLVKVVHTIPDEELLPMMGARGIQELSRLNHEDCPLDRMNEMLDVLGKCEEAQRSRSQNKKLNRIKSRLREIFTTNEWRIRDMALANRIGSWIVDYIKTGNLAALTNFCKLKVMTHHNMPIYSVEEEK